MKNLFTNLWVKTFLLTFLMLMMPQITMAGGSSYSFYTYPDSGIVKSGSTFTNVFRLNLQTYIHPEYFQIDQIAIKTIKLSCQGDDTLQSARLRLGSSVLASADFVPSALAPHWYKAELLPKNLILENNATYNLGLDVTTKPDITGTRVNTCHAEILDHSQMLDGSILGNQERGLLHTDQTSTSMIVTTSDDGQLNNGSSYRSINAENSIIIDPQLSMRGKITKTGKNTYKITGHNTDWVNEGLYNVMIPYYYSEGPFAFDLISPRYFSAEQLRNSNTPYAIQKMHLYEKKTSNGSIGSIKLTST